MNYKMEELLPIVGTLADKYTSFESTSITYEKAQELMEAVLYCIHELEVAEYEAVFLSESDALLLSEKITAKQAYEVGFSCVEKKVKTTLNLYNQILPELKNYENICLRDSFIKVLPEFFKWYDITFAPQNTIITLDYPVLKDISCYTGVDRIYEFLLCISWEQEFLKLFPEDYIIYSLSKSNPLYEEMIENICEAVLMSVTAHLLADKTYLERNFTEKDFCSINNLFSSTSHQNITCEIKHKIEQFFSQYYKHGNKLFEYFSGSINGVLLRIKNALKNQILSDIF